MMAPNYGQYDENQTILFRRFRDTGIATLPESPSNLPALITLLKGAEESPIPPTSCHDNSPLFDKLPLELRRSVYAYVFHDSAMLIDSNGRSVRCPDCGITVLCSNVAHHGGAECEFRGNPLTFTGPAQYRVLQTNKGMYHEARPILASALRLHIAFGMGSTFQFQMSSKTGHHAFLDFALPYIRYVYTDSAEADDEFLLPSYLPKLQTFELGRVWFRSSSICPLLDACREHLDKKADEAHLVRAMQKVVRHEDANISRLVRLEGRTFNIIVIVDFEIDERNGCVSLQTSLDTLGQR
jgi:hypothetical protein